MDLAQIQQQPMQPPMPQEQPMGQPQTLQGLQGGGAVKQQVVQMMTALAQNPTPEMAQQVAQALQIMGDADAAQAAPLLLQVANNPQTLTQIATKILQRMQE